MFYNPINEDAHWDAIQRENEEYAEKYRQAHYFDFESLTKKQADHIKKSWEAVKAEFINDMAFELLDNETQYADFVDNIIDYADGWHIDVNREV